ncbi:transcription factor MYB3R-2-like isoform X1 [Carica papaya]|uniref:transcription factor MYB3R-2-like isoform X1 n=1 Tax=Carica papaya TaxID=3649 RepID=UPI000B8CD206|nr:transcription factor MYB3R-2-like isoform X1 [Carica papaya]
MGEDKEPNFVREKEGLDAASPSVSNGSCDHLPLKPASVHGRITGPTRRSTKGGWTQKEDENLISAVQKYKGKNWKKIAECVPDRTDVQCLHRWQKVLNPDLVKGPWSIEEDNLIIKIVGEQGNKKWSEIAKHLPGRIGKQCRERWYNHLNPEIKRSAWTKEEEIILITAHREHGNKWAEIAKLLPGRYCLGTSTENSIKNHWNCSVRKKAELFSSSNPELRICGLNNENRKSDTIKINTSRQDLNHNRRMDSLSLDLPLGNEIKDADKVQKITGSGNEDALATSLNGGNCREGCTYEESKHIGSSNQTSPFHDTSCVSFPHLLTRTDEAGKHINFSPSRKMMEPLSALSTPLSSHGCNGKTRSSLSDHGTEEVAFPVTSEVLATPPSQNEGELPTSCMTPESILRIVASTYKNTPSIIRRRGSSARKRSRNGCSCSLEERIDKLENSHEIQHPRFCDNINDVQQDLVSSLKSQKLESCATNSMEKSPSLETVKRW